MIQHKERSMWMVGVLLIVLALPLEVALIWAIWKMGAFAIPFFFALIIFFVFGSEKSRSAFMSSSSPYECEPDTIPCPRMGREDDVLIPPPPRVPRDMIGRTGSTLPSPPSTIQEFEQVAQRITSRPPPAIN